MNAREADGVKEAPSAYRALPDLAPPDVFDPVIEAYKKDVDRTLLRENLKLTVERRARKFLDFIKALDELRGAATRKDNPGRKTS
jgi:hypothetical protein